MLALYVRVVQLSETGFTRFLDVQDEGFWREVSWMEKLD